MINNNCKYLLIGKRADENLVCPLYYENDYVSNYENDYENNYENSYENNYEK